MESPPLHSVAGGFPRGVTSCFRTLLALLALGLAVCGLPATASAAGPSAIKDVDYNLDEFGPDLKNLNALDIYLPGDDSPATGPLRPVVVWVHGGGHMTGDKSNKMADKVRLFNGMGYILVSLNYRLSPDISKSCCTFAPDRVRAPAHISDVGEAIGWMTRNIQSYGGDPDRLVLVGHSAGAQLVSLAGTSPAWSEGRGASSGQFLGVVSLDTDTFMISRETAASSPLQARMLAWNAFGTPEEEAVEPVWDRMSPLLHADPSDPPFLFVTQSTKPGRMAANGEMATALGQDPAATVVGVPLDHEGVNDALGSASDSTVETSRVTQFVQEVVSSASPAGVTIRKRPAKRVVVKVPRHRRKAPLRKVAFAFAGTGRAASLQCRMDRGGFGKCRSPRVYRLRPGSHTFRVRALYPSGRPGHEKKVIFRVVAVRNRR